MDRGRRGIFKRSGQWTFQLGFRAGDLSEWRQCLRDGVGRKFIGVKRSIRSRRDRDDRETPAGRGEAALPASDMADAPTLQADGDGGGSSGKHVGV